MVGLTEVVAFSYLGPRDGPGTYADLNFFDQETNQFGFIFRVPLNLYKYLEEFASKLHSQRKSIAVAKSERQLERQAERQASEKQAEKKVDFSIEQQPSLHAATSPTKSAKLSANFLTGKSSDNATPLLNNLFSGIKGTVNRKDAEMVGW